MDTPAPAPQSSGSRWWLRALLIVSLALNLAFIGLAVGAAMRPGGPDGRRPQASIGAALFRAMPPEDRAALRDQMRQMREADRGEARSAEAAAIVEALTRTPFIADELAAVARSQMTRHTDWFTAAQDAWLARIEAMSPADRAAYAQRLGEILEQKPRRRAWFGRRDD